MMEQAANRRISACFHAFLERARSKRDHKLARERSQALIRLVNSLVVLVYFILSYSRIEPSARYSVWLAAVSFVVLSSLAFALTVRASASSDARRIIMLVADVGFVSYGIAAAGEAGIPLFLLYFSITLGNGFRFGLRSMTASAILSLFGFSVVVLLSPIWATLTAFAAAIMVALTILPFSARVIRDLKAMNGEVAPSAIVDTNRRSGAPICGRAQPVVRKIDTKRVDELGREQGQAKVRLANSLLVLLYLASYYYPIDFAAGYPIWLIFLGGFIAFSALILLLTLRAGKTSVLRRIVGNVGDVCAISGVMLMTAEMGIPLFIFYLSTTLANGFRFGLPAMIVSGVLSLAGFSFVLALSSVWQALPTTVPVGIVLSLVLLPAYAAHLIHQLAKATKQAEEASAAKSRFLARMSHELRTPLNGILGTTELLGSSKRLTREDRSLLDIIRDSVKISMRQIDNVLDFSKIEAGKLTIEQVNFDLHALLNRAVRLVRATALEKNLRLTLRIDPAIPYRLIGDPHHLHEVLLNLLSNAIKFTDKGYVSLEAHSIHADQASALVRFEVYDTGIGIEPNAVARIFEAFTQEDSDTTRRYGGTGLGTTIAKQLVELMGGALHVESTKGKGSVFAAEIRFACPPQDWTAGVDPVIASTVSGTQVLLVSKSEGLKEHMASLLAKWGASLKVASSVTDAVVFLGRSIRLGTPVDAAFIDGEAVFTRGGVHCANDFIEKAALSSTPVFLVCDVAPGETELRQWGYAGVLSYGMPGDLLFNVLHFSHAYEASIEPGVVQVEPWAWGGARRSRPRVLVADDNRTNLMILRKILENANFEVDTAENGEQALEMLLSTRYKVAVLDMHMPGFDGIDVIKQYRMMRVGARLPIIMLTANTTIDAKLESAEAGADAYLTKPATASVLISTIKKLLDDTEVHELKRKETSPTQDIPILDTEVITELDRLYTDPAEIARLLDTFDVEGRRLLLELRAALEKKDRARFFDLLHALKGNGANMGAVQLAQLCFETERKLGNFPNETGVMLERLESAFAQASEALRGFTGTGESRSARGREPN